MEKYVRVSESRIASEALALGCGTDRGLPARSAVADRKTVEGIAGIAAHE